MYDTRRDLAMALAVVLFGLAVLSVTGTIRDGVYRDAIGPRMFPYGVGFTLLLGGAILVIRRLRAMHAESGYLTVSEGTSDEGDAPASAVRAVGIMALSLAYLLVFERAGYLLATPVYVAATLIAMQERRPLVIASLALVWTAVTYWVFAQLLGVRLPVGPFTSWFQALGLTAY